MKLPDHKITTDEAIALSLVYALGGTEAAERFMDAWGQILDHNSHNSSMRKGDRPRHWLAGGLVGDVPITDDHAVERGADLDHPPADEEECPYCRGPAHHPQHCPPTEDSATSPDTRSE